VSWAEHGFGACKGKRMVFEMCGLGYLEMRMV